MREHLTAKEISRWLVEGPGSDDAAHVRSCPSCAAKLAEVRAPLSVFRSAVVAWSEGQTAAPAREPAGWVGLAERLNFMNWVPAFGLALALAVLAALLVGPSIKRQVPTQAKAPVAPISDGVLMEQVDAEVSETVPDAMAPLTDLVAWDSDEAPAQKTGAPKRAAKIKSIEASRPSVTD
jgi:hypothetical protein